MRKDFIPASEAIIEISELMVPSNSNFQGKIHGGYVLSLMDKVAFACASKFSGKYCITASVDKVDFLSPVEVGELLILKAKINYTGNSSMVVGIRVDSQNIQTGEIKHCNSSYFTMVARENNKSVKIPGLIIETHQDLRRFAESIERINTKKEIKNKKLQISPEEYIAALDNQNVKLEIKV